MSLDYQNLREQQSSCICWNSRAEIFWPVLATLNTCSLNGVLGVIFVSISPAGHFSPHFRSNNGTCFAIIWFTSVWDVTPLSIVICFVKGYKRFINVWTIISFLHGIQIVSKFSLRPQFCYAIDGIVHLKWCVNSKHNIKVKVHFLVSIHRRCLSAANVGP